MIFLNLVFVLLGFCKDCTILYLRCLQKTWLTRTKRQKLCNQSKSEDKLLNGIRVSVDKKQKLWKCLRRSDGSNTLHFVFLLFNDFYNLFLGKSENISTEKHEEFEAVPLPRTLFLGTLLHTLLLRNLLFVTGPELLVRDVFMCRIQIMFKLFISPFRSVNLLKIKSAKGNSGRATLITINWVFFFLFFLWFKIITSNI